MGKFSLNDEVVLRVFSCKRYDLRILENIISFLIKFYSMMFLINILFEIIAASICIPFHSIKKISAAILTNLLLNKVVVLKIRAEVSSYCSCRNIYGSHIRRTIIPFINLVQQKIRHGHKHANLHSQKF